MLDGSILKNYSSDTSFSDTCLKRMDLGLPFPFPGAAVRQELRAAQLGAIGVALCGLAWLSLVFGLKLPRGARPLAALPAAPNLVLALVSIQAALDTGRGSEGYFSVWLWVSSEVAAIVMLIVLGQRHLEVLGPPFVRPAIVLWAATAFGMLHAMLEYSGMLLFSSANWDDPPGTGAITVLVLLAGAVAAASLALHPTRLARSPTDQPRDHPQPAELQSRSSHRSPRTVTPAGNAS